MARYFSRPKQRVRSNDGLWSDDIGRTHTVEVCDHEPTDTGLLDKNIHTIWRAPNPIGFQFP